MVLGVKCFPADIPWWITHQSANLGGLCIASEMDNTGQDGLILGARKNDKGQNMIGSEETKRVRGIASLPFFFPLALLTTQKALKDTCVGYK